MGELENDCSDIRNRDRQMPKSPIIPRFEWSDFSMCLGNQEDCNAEEEAHGRREAHRPIP
jgi:hypothetical protein